MKNQLQEQLLKSGLVNASQIRSAKAQKNKQVKQQQHNKIATADEVKEQVQQARIEQAAKDRELNEQRKQDEERKHRAAQVKQLIEHNRLPQDKILADDSIAFHFSDNNKVKTLYVLKSIQQQISNGQLAIVKLGQQYEIVPAETALKIKLREESTVIVFNDSDSSRDNKDDTYAAYQIPDDLMW
jgi:uncharacterized protein